MNMFTVISQSLALRRDGGRVKERGKQKERQSLSGMKRDGEGMREEGVSYNQG